MAKNTDNEQQRLARIALDTVGSARHSAETETIGTCAELARGANDGFGDIYAKMYYDTLKGYVDATIDRIEENRANLTGAAIIESGEHDEEGDFARLTDENVEAATEGRRGDSARFSAENADRVPFELRELQEKLDFVTSVLDRTEPMTVRDGERLVRYGLQLLEPGVRTAIAMAYSGSDNGLGDSYASSAMEYLKTVDRSIVDHPYVQAVRMAGKAFGTKFTDQLDGIGDGTVALFTDAQKKTIDISTPEGYSVYENNVARSTIGNIPPGLLTEDAKTLAGLIRNHEGKGLGPRGFDELKERFGIEVRGTVPDNREGWKDFRAETLGVKGEKFGTDAILERSGQEQVLRNYMELYRTWTDLSSDFAPLADRLCFAKDKPFGLDVDCEATKLFAGNPVSATSGESIRSAIMSLKARQIYQEAHIDATGHEDAATRHITDTLQKGISDFLEKYAKHRDRASEEISEALNRIQPQVTEWVSESVSGTAPEWLAQVPHVTDAGKAVGEMFARCPVGANPDEQRAASLMRMWNSIGPWDSMKQKMRDDIPRLCTAIRAGADATYEQKKMMDEYNPMSPAFGRGLDDHDKAYRLMIGASVLTTVPECFGIFGNALRDHNQAVREYYRNDYLDALDSFAKVYKNYFHTMPDEVKRLSPENGNEHGKPIELFEGTRRFNTAFFGSFVDLATELSHTEGPGTEEAKAVVLKAVLDGVNPIRSEQAYLHAKQLEGANLKWEFAEGKASNTAGKKEGYPFTKGLGISFESATGPVAEALGRAAETAPEGVDRNMVDRIACAGIAKLTPEAWALYVKGHTTDAKTLYMESKELGDALDRILDGAVLSRMSEKGLAFDGSMLERQLGGQNSEPARGLDGIYPSLSVDGIYRLGPTDRPAPSALDTFCSPSPASAVAVPVPKSSVATGFKDRTIADYRTPMPELYRISQGIDKEIKDQKAKVDPKATAEGQKKRNISAVFAWLTQTAGEKDGSGKER